MPFVNYIKVPFIEAYSINYSELASLGILVSGNYQLIPEAYDTFDTYETGGGALTQLFFSGSGWWMGSGYTVNNNYYFYDTFDSYQTGLISGYGILPGGGTGFLASETGLPSGINISGYYVFNLATGYTIWSGYLI